eukprot:5983847-Amphidinium_carterae.1
MWHCVACYSPIPKHLRARLPAGERAKGVGHKSVANQGSRCPEVMVHWCALTLCSDPVLTASMSARAIIGPAA